MRPMNYFLIAVEIVSGVGILAGAIIPFFVWLHRLIEGQKCQLRSDMLHTYYKHKDDRIIRQYEFENFLFMYKAYKALKGNSFIDEIYSVVTDWEIVS